MILKSIKIGPNEKTGMNTFYKVDFFKREYAKEGEVFLVGIARNEDGMFMRDHIAVRNGFWAYKSKSDALRLFKDVVSTIKNSGKDDVFNQEGKLEVKE